MEELIFDGEKVAIILCVKGVIVIARRYIIYEIIFYN